MAAAEIFPLKRAVPAIGIGAIAASAVLLLPIVGAAVLTTVLCLLPLAWYAFSVPYRWLAMFFAAALLLPPLPLPGGDTGPHPSVPLAAIGVLAGMASFDRWRIRWGPIHTAFAALALAMVLSVAFAALYSGVAIAAGSAARAGLFFIGVYIYFTSASGPDLMQDVTAQRMTRALFWIALAAAAFGCIDFVYQLPAPAGYEPQFVWLKSGVYRRAQGLFYEASTLGNFSAFFLVATVVALAEPRWRRIFSPVALGSGLIVFPASLLLSFSRSSVICAGLAVLVLVILERRRWQSRRTLIVLAVLIPAAAGVFALTLPEVAGAYWGRVGFTLDRLLIAPDRVLSGRLESWGAIAGFIAEHPWQTLFGIGYKTLPYTEYLGRPVIADNMYLSLLVETGVLGLAALVGLNAAILVTCWRAMQRGSFYGKWLLCFWIGEVVQMLTGDILTYWRVLPVYFWVLAQATKDAYADSAD
ncbi:MAG: O-antigen polymerase [Bryobacterales bacterium]|nr:O-antigen polymerase [Bryobacterales bacterium]